MVHQHILNILHEVAVDKRYQGHKIGTSILDQIIKRVFTLAADWPIRLITLDAIRDKYDWYKRMGFKALDESKLAAGDFTIAMYMDCNLNMRTLNDGNFLLSPEASGRLAEALIHPDPDSLRMRDEYLDSLASIKITSKENYIEVDVPELDLDFLE